MINQLLIQHENGKCFCLFYVDQVVYLSLEKMWLTARNVGCLVWCTIILITCPSYLLLLTLCICTAKVLLMVLYFCWSFCWQIYMHFPTSWLLCSFQHVEEKMLKWRKLCNRFYTFSLTFPLANLSHQYMAWTSSIQLPFWPSIFQ